jgi:hypothetical protein
MDNISSNSRSSSRYSKSVVLPRIKTDQKHKELRRTSNENLGTDFGRISSRDQDDDFNKYILERLDFTERSLETERRERNVLEEHVRGLVFNLQRLSKDMAALQQQLKSEESNAHSQNVALQNLEMHQVSGIGDVWNRLTLGDLNTIKLSGDLNKLSGDVEDLKRSRERSKENLEKFSKDVQSLGTKVEKSSLEFEKNLQVLKVELDSKVTTLERGLEIADKWNERMEKRNQRSDGNEYPRHEFEDNYLQALKNFELRFDQFVENQESWKEGVNKRFSVFDEDLLQVKGTTSIKYEALTRRIDDLKTNQKKALEKSLEGVKDNYREAFRAVYESITTMQTVLEAKLKITEADLKTSINSILKTISQ